MDIDKARWAVENLFQRIERDPVGGNWRLNGSITQGEREAMAALLSLAGGETALLAGPTVQIGPSSAATYPLVLTSVDIQEPTPDSVMLCLDFGTAMSKAFAFDEFTGEPLDLALGTRAGYTESVYAVPSSIFISDSGRIFFGHEAIDQSDRTQTPGRQRFDSPKQELSQGNLVDLSSAPVSNEINPTGVPFTKEELITLYLAYLTDLACVELEAHRTKSRYVRRRFARPCWDATRVAWAEALLITMLSKAQVVADSLTSRWAGGLEAAGIRQLFDELKTVTPSANLVDTGVEEPVAAAASIVLQSPDRQTPGFLVVDVGAGTTDFGLFVVIQRPTDPEPILMRLRGSILGIRQAGDTVDHLLRAFILRKHAVDLSTPYGLRIAAGLGLSIRRYKEALFDAQTLSYSLADDTSGTVTLADFQESDEIKRFSQALRDAMKRSFDGVHESWIRRMFERPGVLVVLTGGGARLPMVKALATGWIETSGLRIQCVRAPEVPAWIANDYPDFVDEYPQLAVAMGGASPDLPEIGPEVAALGGLPAPTYVAGNLQTRGP